jgi:hypothetical protein
MEINTPADRVSTCLEDSLQNKDGETAINSSNG